MPPLDSEVASLADALARGRLAIADVAGVTTPELDAIFELAAEQLEAERHNEAVSLLGGLVTLFPFSARYWRAYGIALHRAQLTADARSAYDVALLLEPNDWCSLCLRSEALMQLGLWEQAAEGFTQARSAPDPEISHRCVELLALLNKKQNTRTDTRMNVSATPSATAGGVQATTPRFVLGDGRPLPLEGSALEELDAAVDENSEVVPRATAVTKGGLNAMAPFCDAIMARWAQLTQAVLGADDSTGVGGRHDDVTVTTTMPRQAPENEATAPVPARPEEEPAARQGGRPAELRRHERTQTAFIRRLLGIRVVGHSVDDAVDSGEKT